MTRQRSRGFDRPAPHPSEVASALEWLACAAVSLAGRRSQSWGIGIALVGVLVMEAPGATVKRLAVNLTLPLILAVRSLRVLGVPRALGGAGQSALFTAVGACAGHGAA